MQELNLSNMYLNMYMELGDGDCFYWLQKKILPYIIALKAEGRAFKANRA